MNTKHPALIEAVSACGAATVLVVDEDAALRKMEVQMLSRLGYSALEAEGLAEARQLAARTPTIHLWLTNLGMTQANELR